MVEGNFKIHLYHVAIPRPKRIAMLAKKREGNAVLQGETAVDVSRDYHKLRYRPYRQNNSLSSKTLLDVSAADQTKEGYISHSPNHAHEPHQQNSNNNHNNNNNNNPGNDQYQNHHHPHHHHHHHYGSRLSRGSTHDIPDGRTSPAKVDFARRERRTMNNKRSNSLFTHHVSQLQHLDNVPGPSQPSTPTTPTASFPCTTSSASTPIPVPVSPDTAATVTPPEYGSDRRKMLIQQRRNNGQFVGHGAIYESSDVGNATKVLGISSQHHLPLQYQYHGHSQLQQDQNYQIAVGNADYYTCHSNGNRSVLRGSDQVPKVLKNAPSLSKRAGKERLPEKTKANNGSRDCPTKNGSFTIGADPGNGFSDAESVRAGGVVAEVNKKQGSKSGRGTPLVSESGTSSVKVTDPTDPGGGQNNGVYAHKPCHNQQKTSSHYKQNEDIEHRPLRANGKVRANEGNVAKEVSTRGVNHLRSIMKWEYEDLYGHMHKSGSDRMTPVRPVRPKSAGVSARTHAIMTDSDDSSLDGDIEYVDLEELSDGEDAIVMTDSELAAANSKQRVPKSCKESSGMGIRRAYSMKDNQANSFTNENPRRVNKILQEARRLRCNDSNVGKPETKWIFADKKTQHSNYQKTSRRECHLRVEDSVDPPNNIYHRRLNAKKDRFDLSSFKDNLSFSQTESLATKCKKLGNGNVCFSVTGEQLNPESLKQLKVRQCGPEATESSRNENGEMISRRNSHAPFPRRLKPLFGNIVEDTET